MNQRPFHLSRRLFRTVTAINFTACLAIIATSASDQAVSADSARAPNIVLIMADDKDL